MDQIAALAVSYFEKFSKETKLELILDSYSKLCQTLKINPCKFPDFILPFKKLNSCEIRELVEKYEKKTSNKPYSNGAICSNTNVLIIGGGPCGLRTAIEAQLLGANVVVIEKRNEFSRNNVLHLWPFVIQDLRDLGAKIFYPKFCSGSIDHISINSLQSILLKIALFTGVTFWSGVEFISLLEPQNSEKCRWKAQFSPNLHVVSNFEFDVIIGADGKQNSLPGFSRKQLKGKLAIGITANFINNHSAREARVPEISGVSFIFKQKFFTDLCENNGIDLENIVYYKDETHYFVMTAKKHSLLWKGVLKENFQETDELLSPSNIDSTQLKNYVIETVDFATEGQLPNLEFALNYRGEADLAIFDFTTMFAAENSCYVIEKYGHKLLLGLVGDSLLEPFWPTGSGCARGFLSSLDAAWMIRSWSIREKNELEIIAERENIYRLLAQTTHDNLSKDLKNYSVDPLTRYPNLVLNVVKPTHVSHLYKSSESEKIYEKQDEKSSTKDKSQEPVQMNKKTIVAKQPFKSSSAKIYNEAKKNEDVSIKYLLEWAQEILVKFDIRVNHFEEIFKNGDALCAILSNFRPDLIPTYPFPPEIEEGIDECDLPAFRNQIAFDFLEEEYGLQNVVNGHDSVEFTDIHISKLIDYLIEVYNLFFYFDTQGQNLSTLLNEQEINFSTDSKFSASNTQIVPDENLLEDENDKSSVPEYFISKSVVKNFPKYENKSTSLMRSATFGDHRSLRDKYQYGSKVKRLQKNFSIESGPSFNDFPKISPNFEQRAKDAESCKKKALDFVAHLRRKKNDEEKERKLAQRQQVVGTIKSVYVNDTESSKIVSVSSTSAKENDDFFNEYNMRLWRKSVPTIEERRGKLNNVLNPLLAQPKKDMENIKTKAEAAAISTTKLKSDIRETNSDSETVYKVNKSDWVMELLNKKFPNQTSQKISSDKISNSKKCDNSQTEIVINHDDSKNEEKKFLVDIENESQIFNNSSNIKSEGTKCITNEIIELKDAFVPPFKIESTIKYMASDDDIKENDQSDSEMYKKENESTEFDENDEEILENLDFSDLEHLESWAGKYL